MQPEFLRAQWLTGMSHYDLHVEQINKMFSTFFFPLEKHKDTCILEWSLPSDCDIPDNGECPGYNMPKLIFC